MYSTCWCLPTISTERLVTKNFQETLHASAYWCWFFESTFFFLCLRSRRFYKWCQAQKKRFSFLFNGNGKDTFWGESRPLPLMRSPFSRVSLRKTPIKFWTFAFVPLCDSHSILLSIKIPSGKRLKTQISRKLFPLKIPLAWGFRRFRHSLLHEIHTRSEVFDEMPSKKFPLHYCPASKIFFESAWVLSSQTRFIRPTRSYLQLLFWFFSVKSRR